MADETNQDNVEIKRTFQSLTPNTRYIVRARSYNNYNVYSDWSEALEFTTPLDDTTPNPITNLSTNFESADLLMSWDPPDTNTDGTQCIDIAHYEVTITGYSGIIRTYRTTTNSFQLLYSRHLTDFGVPVSQLSVSIVAADYSDHSSLPVSAVVVNSVPNTPDPPSVESVTSGIAVYMVNGIDDFKEYILEYTTNLLDPNSWQQVYQGYSSPFVHYVSTADTYYYRYRIVDVFGQVSSPSSPDDYTLAVIDPPPSGVSGSVTVNLYLDDLLDVDVSSATPTAGQYLYFDGNEWIPQTVVTTQLLNDLTDVDTTSAVSGEFLWFNGSTWESHKAGDVTAYVDTIGDGVSSTFTVTHNLNCWNPVVQVRQTYSPYEYYQSAIIKVIDSNNIEVEISLSTPITDEYTVIVHGKLDDPIEPPDLGGLLGTEGGDLLGTESGDLLGA